MEQILFILLTVILTALCDEQCAPDTDWKYNNDTNMCYYFNTQLHQGDTRGLTWRRARNWCLANGGDLASMHSGNETDFIFSVMPRDQQRWSWWIGLNELDFSGGYKWSDGTPLDYESWGFGEPNDRFDGYGGHELCTELMPGSRWNDQMCSMIRGFICKKNPGGRPPPATQRPLELPGNCPPTFLPYGNKCYRFVHMKKSWYDAQAYCTGLGANVSKAFNLVSISDDTEQAFITSQLINKPHTYWIGMKKSYRSKFYWTDNSDVTYTNWNRGEPNGGADGEQKCRPLTGLHTILFVFHGFHLNRRKKFCVQINNNAARVGEWNDELCSDSQFFICQTLKDTKYPQLAQQPNSCGSDNIQYGPGCYKLVSVPSTWQDARASCQQQEGYDLVAITSQYEQGFIRTLMKQNDMIYENISLWTGLTDRKNPGRYEWIGLNEWPVIYTNWGEGQPVKDQGGCVLVRPDDGRWYDTNCSKLAYGLCKKFDAMPPQTSKQYGACPHTQDGDHWVRNDGHCYLFRVKEPLSHGDAELACQILDARLATVHSNEENNFIMSRLHSAISWIGLVKSLSRGYQWKDGSAVGYMNWDDSQGSDKIATLDKNATFNKNATLDKNATVDQNCVQMYVSGKWADVQCSLPKGYVCKREQLYAKKLPVSQRQEAAAAVTGIAIAVSVIAVIALITGLYFLWKKKYYCDVLSYFHKKPLTGGFSPSDIVIPDKTKLSNSFDVDVGST